MGREGIGYARHLAGEHGHQRRGRREMSVLADDAVVAEQVRQIRGAQNMPQHADTSIAQGQDQKSEIPPRLAS